MSLGRIFTLALTGTAFLFCFVNLGISTMFDLRTATRKVQVVETHATAKETQELQHNGAVTVSFSQSDNLEPIPRPPLRSIVREWNITGDPSWLLQFSIVGFPKSGTSTLMFHLRSHPEIHIFKDERCELAFNQHARLIEDLYRQFPPSNTTHRFVRGIKCPLYLESPQFGMRNYRKVFPKTDFIVGIRHPVLWFVLFALNLVRNASRILQALSSLSSGSKAFTTLGYTMNSKCHLPKI
jgi:hypothetical protein